MLDHPSKSRNWNLSVLSRKPCPVLLKLLSQSTPTIESPTPAPDLCSCSRTSESGEAQSGLNLAMKQCALFGVGCIHLAAAAGIVLWPSFHIIQLSPP